MVNEKYKQWLSIKGGLGKIQARSRTHKCAKQACTIFYSCV